MWTLTALLAMSALQAAPVEGLPGGVELAVPAAPGARWPSLTAGADGELYLTWTEPRGPAAPESWTLGVARLTEAGWERLADASSGEGWFVNWADFPALAALPGGVLAAHFLARTGTGTYAYEVRVILSRDGGASWTEPVRLHDDARPAEHGFVSLAPWEDGFAAVWLDGRGTVDGGPMALFARTLAVDGTLGPEVRLDGRVCDCCQTASVGAGRGLVVAYRDRGPEERRDIAWLSLGPGALAGGPVARPRDLARDGWTIAGCPVNGPALAAKDGVIAAAWFTLGADERPRVLVRGLRRDGSDDRDGAPLALSEAAPLGRVDAAFDGAGDLWVTWLEERGEAAEWRAARVDLERGASEARVLVRVPSGGREAGFGRLAPHGGGLYFAWTEPADAEHPARVRTARLKP